ncbi:MAG: sugar phosphate nucleotidyltransferase [Gemmatimonadaceae bacterium]|jgi:mannose-1-phosphate guanylyltransferase|nr:sugar phosphate nucleotidyltransferase [Gemmatimonadaceae bacterium]
MTTPRVPGSASSGESATGVIDPGLLEELDPESSVDVGTSMWAVVFAGGIGTRFWPISTPDRPKQVLPLVDERPLIADTLARLAPLVPASRVLVVTSADIADVLHAAIPELPRANLLVEPRPLGTAAALAWGAQEVARRAGPRTVFVALHADLAVEYRDVFHDTVRRAAAVASRDAWLVTIGIRPSRCEPAFGYLTAGVALDPFVPLSEGGACRVEHFVEKPSLALADTLIAEGALWNSGVFVWQAQVVLDQLAERVPEIAHGLPYLSAGEMSLFVDHISATISIDRGLLERSDRVVVLPADFGWDDVGTWASLRRVRELDDTGNGCMGTVHCVDASGNIAHCERGEVVMYGVSGLLVVSIDSLTFVTTLDRATELGPLIAQLPPHLRVRPGKTPPVA